jgi:hypothetical protein
LAEHAPAGDTDRTETQAAIKDRRGPAKREVVNAIPSSARPGGGGWYRAKCGGVSESFMDGHSKMYGQSIG